MEISTFSDDLIGLEEFATQLERFIEIERQYVDGGLVIGLSSKFGSGKSTFFQMWKSSLEEKKAEEENNTLIILLNAWESDYFGDPLFAIVSALVNDIKKEGISAEKLVYAAQDIGRFATAIGDQVLKKYTGIDPAAAAEKAGKKKKERNKEILILPDAFSFYEGRKKAMLSLKEALLEFVESNKAVIYFLVDELDRCRPDYAISYLETIKHIFDIKGAVFLLAADRQHLENSAKTAFGPNLDFDEYYRKFVHREVSLPNIPEASYKNIASKYVNYYLEGSGSRNCFMKLDQVNFIVELVTGYKLTPRQIQEVFRILGHIFETTQDQKGNLLWCIGAGSILMVVLKIANPEEYYLLGSKQLHPDKLLDFFREHIKNSHLEWWFTLCLTGGGLKIENDATFGIILKNAGFISEDIEFDPSRELAQWFRGWGFYGWSPNDKNRFKEIFRKIEQIEQWS
ncbi:MAG: hypothetical protein KC449_23070 [Anaerolineales bacterium]|nr:hypothetical protein [Anaerolineales bacterium]